MSDKSAIEWTDATWNPVTGCSKVSQGCKNCYAERLWPKLEAAERKRNVFEWGMAPKRPFTQIRCHPDRLEYPLRWAKPKRIFVNSLSDLFHEDVPDDFIYEVFETMAGAPQHSFQVLTKRPARMQALLTDLSAHRLAHYIGHELPLPNAWLGVSIEDQATADERIPLLLQTPAAVRFISAEPLLGPIDFTVKCPPHFQPNLRSPDRIAWVIAGGESGPNARPSHPDWFRSLRDQCAGAGVPFFFKQWGEWAPDNCQGPNVWQHLERRWARWMVDGAWTIEPPGKWPDDDNLMFRLGKKNAGRELDGRMHDEYPA